eukprot:gnl/MRDRNA2_/MRDRNA2_73833_c0_seq2.p1 gnl/MRDRNA2_/MRDRNA2_73833_c0~~gnl/MRDRNA2_/MRDRNA2_73833_c0_seq2.p1  ORF type:complete len:427 (+),score=45.33 gnl/MRDRNA2_/MRDRNA2_73833_c0_seq2:175-1455(+)
MPFDSSGEFICSPRFTSPSSVCDSRIAYQTLLKASKLPCTPREPLLHQWRKRSSLSQRLERFHLEYLEDPHYSNISGFTDMRSESEFCILPTWPCDVVAPDGTIHFAENLGAEDSWLRERRYLSMQKSRANHRLKLAERNLAELEGRVPKDVGQYYPIDRPNGACTGGSTWALMHSPPLPSLLESPTRLAPKAGCKDKQMARDRLMEAEKIIEKRAFCHEGEESDVLSEVDVTDLHVTPSRGDSTWCVQDEPLQSKVFRSSSRSPRYPTGAGPTTSVSYTRIRSGSPGDRIATSSSSPQKLRVRDQVSQRRATSAPSTHRMKNSNGAGPCGGYPECKAYGAEKHGVSGAGGALNAEGKPPELKAGAKMRHYLEILYRTSAEQHAIESGLRRRIQVLEGQLQKAQRPSSWVESLRESSLSASTNGHR